MQIIIWGATGHAKVIRECLSDSSYDLTAIFDNNTTIKAPFPDIQLYYGFSGFESWLSKQNSCNFGFIIAIGGDKGRDRLDIHSRLEEFGLQPITVKHRTAFVAADSQVGPGSQVLARSVVCSSAIIGKQCIINTNAIVDHECVLDDGVHICPGAVLAGCIRVGTSAMIGAGAVVLPRIRIGQGAVVGAGAVVTKDVEPHAVVVGNPARKIRSVKFDGSP